MNNNKNRQVRSTDGLLKIIYQSIQDTAQLTHLPGQILHYLQQNLKEEGRSEFPNVLTSVMGHLKRAFRLGVVSDRLRYEKAQLDSIVDALLPAVYVINSNAIVLSMNGQARMLAQQSTGLVVRNDRLFTLGSSLQEAIQDARQQNVGCIRITAPNGNVLSAFVNCIDVHEDYYAVMLFSEIEALDHSVAAFSKRYKLSPKECLIVQKMMRQLSTKSIAQEVEISYHTLRQHLQVIYQKTQITSQAKLLSAVVKQTVFNTAERDSKVALPHITGLVYSRFVIVGDQRKLCYADFGDPDGIPLLHFSSMNLSRLELIVLKDQFKAMGIRLISVDGPGFGHSDKHKYASFMEYVADIEQLLNYLNMDKIDVLCRSAGTPVALALAAAYPDRVKQVISAGAFPPFDHIDMKRDRMGVVTVLKSLHQVAPMLLQPVLEFVLNRVSPEEIFLHLTENDSKIYPMCQVDKDYVMNPDRIDYFVTQYVDSFRQGSASWIRAVMMGNTHWDIPYNRIQCPVHFWHGSRDVFVGYEAVSSFVSQLPSASLTVIEDGTHYMLYLHLERILESVVNGNTETE